MPSETTNESEHAVLDSPTAAVRPEEMKGMATFRLGDWVSVTATGRTTPAGLISAAVFACAILIPVLLAIRRR